MNPPDALPRSPELMSRHDTGLLVVDVQEKLIRLIPGHERIVFNIRRLLDGAKILGVPATGTEQYPQGLGPTVAELAGRLGKIPGKVAFSCGECPTALQEWSERGIRKLLVVGIETHVCIQQTVTPGTCRRYAHHGRSGAVRVVRARRQPGVQTNQRASERATELMSPFAPRKGALSRSERRL